MGNYEPTTFFILENEELGTWWVGKSKIELDAMDFPTRRSVSQSELLTKLEKKFETHHMYTRPSLDIRFLNNSGIVCYGIERFLSKLDYKIRKNPQMYEELRKLLTAGWTNDDLTMNSTLHVLHIWNPNKLTNINDLYSDLKRNWGMGGEGQLRSFHKLNKCLNERISKPKDVYLYQKGRAKLLREMKKTGKRPKQSTIEKYKITFEEILYIKEMPEEQLVMEEVSCQPCEPPKFYKKGRNSYCPCDIRIDRCSNPECKILGSQMGMRVGGSICEHNTIRSTCKKCDGGEVCEHDKIRSRCKKCDGGYICSHKQYRSNCKICGGVSICEHNINRAGCRKCVGSAICEHSRTRSVCKICKGGALCDHKRERSSCKICHPQSHIARLRRSRRLNVSNSPNPTHTLDDLCMTTGEWLKYLHKTFEDRYGRPKTEEDEVHIDEIIPCSAWNLPEDNKYCWHYLNSQWLLARDNLSKHDSYEEEDKLAMIERIQSSL
jgi:hypothetical protein